jgi:hypothetical protein
MKVSLLSKNWDNPVASARYANMLSRARRDVASPSHLHAHHCARCKMKQMKEDRPWSQAVTACSDAGS